MAVQRQAGLSETSGRINQKRRTRTAILAAAQTILDRGDTPTVAEAAKAAMVSRTTAYSYFPTQDALLLELSVNIDVRELEGLVNAVDDDASPEQRVLDYVDLHNRHALANERLYRSALRFYMDLWLAGDERGEDRSANLREGRRLGWLSSILDPVRGQLSEAEFDRLTAALSLVCGVEAVTVLRDVCHVDADTALDVTHWAADAILRAALTDR
jgi:AcrR family transcriptional regulator